MPYHVMPAAIWFNSPILINIQILGFSEKLVRFFIKNVLSRISAAHNKFNIGMKVIRTFILYAGPKCVAVDWIFSVHGFFFFLFVSLWCNLYSFFRSIEMNEKKEKNRSKRRKQIFGVKEDWSNGRW